MSWLMRSDVSALWQREPISSPGLVPWFRVDQVEVKSGDQAGSEAKPGGRHPLLVPAGDDRPYRAKARRRRPDRGKNIMTRPLGAKVGPSLW